FNCRRKMKKLIIFITLSILSLLYPYAASGETRNIELRAERYSYTPNIITVNKGDIIRLKLISTDVTHGFYLDGYEINFFARPGENKEVVIKADRTGRFVFRCSNTCGEFHPYMIGLLKVEPNRLYFFGVYFSIILGIGAVILTIRRKNVGSFKLFGLIPLDWRFELTKYKFVRSLFKSRLFPFVPILINLAIFSALLLAMFTGGFSAGNYNVGIMIVWILWWVLLMLFMVPVVGRFWCMVCPFPMIGDWIQRGKLLVVGSQKSRGLNKRWPKKWNNLWPLVILFFMTTWFSGFFTVRPLASFILLGGIILGAILFSLFFQKRSFCLYACPVSGFQGLYANFSLCEVRVKDPNICKNNTPKTCAVGSEKGYGCPWMELPYDMNRNTYCGLCLECFKTCPYDNMAFNVRPSGADFMAERRRTDELYNRRGTDEAFKALTMIGIFFSFFIAFQGPFGTIKDNIRAVTPGGYLTYILEATTVDFLLIPV
ncbi:hypothetical protein LCGC14_2538250, partial [marine sediment metagenome]